MHNKNGNDYNERGKNIRCENKLAKHVKKLMKVEAENALKLVVLVGHTDSINDKR